MSFSEYAVASTAPYPCHRSGGDVCRDAVRRHVQAAPMGHRSLSARQPGSRRTGGARAGSWSATGGSRWRPTAVCVDPSRCWLHVRGSLYGLRWMDTADICHIDGDRRVRSRQRACSGASCFRRFILISATLCCGHPRHALSPSPSFLPALRLHLKIFRHGHSRDTEHEPQPDHRRRGLAIKTHTQLEITRPRHPLTISLRISMIIHLPTTTFCTSRTADRGTHAYVAKRLLAQGVCGARTSTAPRDR